MPEMRAEQLKENLYALLALGNDTASRILADLPPQHLRRIEQAARTDWIPIDVDLVLVEVVQRAVGDDGLRRWSRAALQRTLDGSLLKPLLETAVRLFGLTPTGLFKMAPQGWRSTFRESGELVISEVTPTSVTMDLVGLPESMRVPPFVVGIGGALEAIFDASHVTGRVTLLEPPPGTGARYHAAWSPR